MVKQTGGDTTTPGVAEACPPAKKTKKRLWIAYTISIAGVVLTIVMFVAVIAFSDRLAELKQYSYLGAFIISVLGGATIIIPVPMLAVVFALGTVMPSVWAVFFLGLSAAAGEVIGSLTIYMTGHGAGKAIAEGKPGRLQRAYTNVCSLIERKGPWILFALASVINPFFYPAALACGAMKFGLGRYTLIVTAGKIIKSMTTVYAGYFGLKSLLRVFGIEIM